MPPRSGSSRRTSNTPAEVFLPSIPMSPASSLTNTLQSSIPSDDAARATVTLASSKVARRILETTGLSARILATATQLAAFRPDYSPWISSILQDNSVWEEEINEVAARHSGIARELAYRRPLTEGRMRELEGMREVLEGLSEDLYIVRRGQREVMEGLNQRINFG